MANTPAGKLDLIMDLYQNGMLCDCRETEYVYTEDLHSYRLELYHKRNCRGRIVAMDLIQEVSLNE